MIQSRMTWKWKKKGFEYILTPEDVLTLARAIQEEGPPHAAVLWTLIQRFAFLYATGEYTNLTKFLRDYVQPINPDWFPDGHRHLAYVRDMETAGNKTEAQLEKNRAKYRPAKAQKTWAQISSTIRHLVEATLTGNRPISRAPGAIHYWASRATAKMSPSEAKLYNQQRRPELALLDVGAGFGPGVNVFFSGSAGQHLKNLAFHKALGAGGVGTALIAGAGLAYFLYRWLS